MKIVVASNTNLHIVLIDRKNWSRLRQYNWYINSSGYAVASIGNGKHVFMHHMILGISGEVDHKNRNRLDNRERNLRPATSTQNNQNRSKSDNCSSKYKGVSWYSQTNRWEAYISKDHKRSRLGYFLDEIEAAMAYNKAATELFGEFAVLNEVR